jgi:hypothetical protein
MEEIGFDGMLIICCDELPRCLVKWLVSHYHNPSKTFELPNGCNFQLKPFHFNKVLGLPIGGREIQRVCPQWIRDEIRMDTGCEGPTPTISELDKYITPDLIGDRFKRALVLYAVTSMLYMPQHI